MDNAWVEKATILRGVVGSTAHGLALEGTDDHDEMGICIEPIERVVGLQGFEQHTFRTAEERARHDPESDQRYQGKTPPSCPGDLDLVVYSLRKYIKLAAAGNPSILVLLFLPDYGTLQDWGDALIVQRNMFASQLAGQRFLGYLKAQKERLLGTRGQMRVTRTDLIQKHGYDTKYAMQAVRLGYQGIEYLNSGRITLPMPAQERSGCMQIRQGRWGLEEVIREIEYCEKGIAYLTDHSPLPKQPDYRAIDRFLSQAYLAHWKGNADQS